jgi:hypothetical protein
MAIRKTLRRRLSDFSELSYDEKRELFFGRPMIYGQGFQNEDDMAVAWRQHRASLQAEWEENSLPGTRCFAEWKFCIVPEYGERKTTEFFREKNRQNLLRHEILHTSTIPMMQESEAEFLFRHGLVDAAEYEEANDCE